MVVCNLVITAVAAFVVVALVRPQLLNTYLGLNIPIATPEHEATHPWEASETGVARHRVGQRAVGPAACDDTAQNGDETGVDCGGSCPDVCPVVCPAAVEEEEEEEEEEGASEVEEEDEPEYVYPVLCSSHGSCVEGACVCEDDYTGDSCDVAGDVAGDAAGDVAGDAAGDAAVDAAGDVGAACATDGNPPTNTAADPPAPFECPVDTTLQVDEHCAADPCADPDFAPDGTCCA